MNVRPAQDKDLPAIVEIVERCGIKTDGLDYTDWTGVLLVAVRQSQVIGFIAALPGRPYAVVTEFGVLPEFQKTRACRELANGMDLLLRSLGCKAWAGYVGAKREINDMMTKWGAQHTGDGAMYVGVFR